MLSSYVHVSPFLRLLLLVLFLAYSEHNPAKHLKPPKLVEFIGSKKIMHRIIFIPTLFTEMLVVDVIINDHQQGSRKTYNPRYNSWCAQARITKRCANLA
jgi:hypothetical protein